MSLTAIFVGDGSLLIECAGQFVAKGGSVLGVVSANERVREWASAATLPVFGNPSAPDLGDRSADFVFSVANLTVLPDTVLAAATKAAINFHDGPLPGYAGLNATSWAIIAGETSHAVTWHEMTGRVDGGPIFAERDIVIAEDETAFSLNAKCFEAGVAAFGEMLVDLFAAGLTGRAQTGERRWFGRDKRPDALATLDFSRPTAELSALVRGLDFGSYANTLTLPKLWNGERLIVVRKLQVLDQPGVGVGVVVSVSEDGLSVATSDGVVALSGFEDLNCTVISGLDLGFAPGGKVPIFDAARLEYGQAAKADGYWSDRIRGLKSAPLAHAKAGLVGCAAVHASATVPLGMTDDQIVAAFGCWLGLLSGETEFALSVPNGTGGSEPWVSGQTLVEFRLNADERVPVAVERYIKAKNAARPLTGDLVARLAEGAERLHGADVVSVAIVNTDSSPDDTLAGRRLVLALGSGSARLSGRRDLFDTAGLAQAAEQLSAFLREFAVGGDKDLRDLGLGGSPDLTGPQTVHDQTGTVHHAFDARAKATPDQAALQADGAVLSFAELHQRATVLAGALAARGAKSGVVVGLCLERSADLVIALLAILKTGAAYLPLDPGYPADRVAFMIKDSGTPLVVASGAVAGRLGLDQSKVIGPDAKGELLVTQIGRSDDLAYLIYTSGSTGTPKGVMVSQANVLNFMAGMDAVVPHKAGDKLLAVTSISFDISVLEIFWTLTRGLTLVLQTDGAAADLTPGFSLFYFASEAAGTGQHAYRLLLEGAKFADENGFEAIWTPERHFHAFGGLYPNPAVASAMIAGITKNVKIRAGSIVLPLHHPVRAAEDWALVDNLSGGRAGMAIASGWQPNDFILQPQNFDTRKDVMLQSIDMIRALWRGEAVEFPNHKAEMIKTTTLPRPVQAQIPLWITAAGNPETFAAAARKGCGVLTHLLGQTFEEVAEKIRAYRVAWAEAGHEGSGTVTLMLHTFVGDDEEAVRNTVRAPMRSYLKSAVDLIKRASWSFPTFVQKGSVSGMTPQQVFEKEELSKEETDALLDHAFDRYYRESGLFGTPDSCVEIVRKVAAIGVDEIACLIDFGVDTDLALAHLHHIKALMDKVKGAGGVSRKASVAEYVVENDVTHLQCTPSAASMLLADSPGRTALGRLQAMLVGGEALPPDLARGLRMQVPGVLLNMYGPTETTVWSSVARLDVVGETVPLGAAIANTTLSVRNAFGQAIPDGIAGELWIGGDGVSQGYWQRPDLTADRFVDRGGMRLYRTGDLVRRNGDALAFLGRIDNQVKIRGHRIELGEIEAKLTALPDVRLGIVVAQADAGGDLRLVGYCTANSGVKLDPKEIRLALAEVLPDFMQPSIIVPLERFPMTPNGKIDRKALPSPIAQAVESQEASGDTEEAIAEIWREALGLAHVGVTENFFDLGGHSLLVVQVQRRLKQRFNKEIPIVDMFRFSTIQALAAQLSGDQTGDTTSAAKRGQERAMARRNRMAQRSGG